MNVNLLLEQVRAVPVRALLMRGVMELGRAIASRTFMFIVAAPFVAWAVALMWVHARFHDEVLRAVADGPLVLLQLWAVFVSVWTIVPIGLGRYRYVLSAALGLVALAVLASCLPGVHAVRGATTHADSPPQLPAREVQ